ncbi:MAG: hypothetical protein ACYSWX_15100 [Planctomycetota bacterium]|jgi:hypothetical protein
MSALSRSDALEYIAGEDPRPLLVLRECVTCNGTDEALLKSGEENERTFLLARWFHCVKLPTDVLEESHPFHGLFLEKGVEHLFVSTRDGANHQPLEVLDESYEGKPSKVVKSVINELDDLDDLDERYNELANRRDEILEEDGPRSRKLPKLERQIAEIDEERKEILAEIDEAFELELLAPEDETSESE